MKPYSYGSCTHDSLAQGMASCCHGVLVQLLELERVLVVMVVQAELLAVHAEGLWLQYPCFIVRNFA